MPAISVAVKTPIRKPMMMMTGIIRAHKARLNSCHSREAENEPEVG
jgi:hypothetical protein